MGASGTRRNYGVWLGPVLAAAGLASYFVLFARWPLTRDVPWVNLLILAGALGLSIGGARRAWKGGWIRRALVLTSPAVSVLLAGFLVTYCFVLSYGLPPSEGALGVGDRVPSLTLADQEGRPVDLAAAGDLVILVFYRGFW